MNNYTTTMMPQSTASVIGFIDVDSYECQLWQRDFPEFRGQPCVVTNPSGRILSASQEAKALGVSRTSTPFIREARVVCPILHDFCKPNRWGKPDSKKTRAGTWEVLNCIREYCAKKGDDIIVELASSDEIYLDISSEITRRMQSLLELHYSKWTVTVYTGIVHEGTRESMPGPFKYQLRRAIPRNADFYRQVQQNEDRLVLGARFMSELCEYLYRNTQLSSSAGVGNNKLLAKLGCGINKPGKVTTFQHGAFKRLSPFISIKNIPGLGGQIGEDLMENFQIKFISELMKLCLSDLERFWENDPKLARRIFSRARGNDDQPVIEKFMKDGLVCNKPSGDIRIWDQLRATLRNLCEEILDRIEEEKHGNKRIAKQVRLGFSFEVESENGDKERVSENTLLDVNSETKFSDLAQQGMKFILNQPNFNCWKFRIIELKFTINEFLCTDNVDNISETMSKTLLLGPKNSLPVNCAADQTDIAPTFSNYKHIGSFRTRLGKIHPNSAVHLPKLIPLRRLFKLKGFNLEAEYATYAHPTELFDSTFHNELKHSFFIKWLQKINYMKKVKDGHFKKPDFVGFSGRFTAPMRSPAIKQFGEWEIYATNIGGIIYLWDERRPKFENARQTSYGHIFEKLAVQRKNTASSKYEMAYVVNELTLDQHQLLVVSNVDAVNAKGDWFEIATWKRSHWNAMFAKFLRAWSQCSVQGSKGLVLGVRNEEGILEDIKIKSVEDMAKSLVSDDYDAPAQCMHFENRFLSFIKTHLPESNGNIVKKFSWTCGNRDAVCGIVQQQVIPTLVLPRLYSSYFNSIARYTNSQN